MDNFWDYGPSYDYSTVDYTNNYGDGGYSNLDTTTGGSYSGGDWSGYTNNEPTNITGNLTGAGTTTYGSEYQNGLGNILFPGSNTQQAFNTASPADFNAALNDVSGVSAQALTPVTPQVTTQYKPEGEGFLSKLFSGAGSKMAQPYEKDPLGSILKTAAGIYGMNQANQNRRAMQQIAQPMQQYQQRLNETYTNPQAYLSSPEAKAMQSQLAQQMLRRDAASGRRSQYGARANELNQQMLSQLGNYRKGLASLYNPSVQGQLTSAIQGQSPGAAGLQALGSLYAPQQTQEQQQAQALLTLLGRK